jgi:hypothetical protein
MINIEKYASILEQGLLLDHYSLLCCLRDGEELPKSKRIKGFINLLHKKGYLSKDKLTSKAIELIDSDSVVCPKPPVIESTVPVITTKGLLKTPTVSDDYLEWAKVLHQKLQDRLIEKTGKKQQRPIVRGTAYSFFPNLADFSKVLLKVIILYKLKDFDKIDKCLIRFLDRKVRENSWTPLLNYYIMKDGASALVTDMGNTEEEENNDANPSIHIV